MRRHTALLAIKLLVLLGYTVAVSGCATMTKQGVTQEQANKDHYECERDAYTAARGAVTDLYKDCMHARGYQ